MLAVASFITASKLGRAAHQQTIISYNASIQLATVITAITATWMTAAIEMNFKTIMPKTTWP